jgi:DNA polymerase iota
MNGRLGREDPNFVGANQQVASTGRTEKPVQWIVPVERLGIDELFLDVTLLIERHLESRGDEKWPDGEVTFQLESVGADDLGLGCWGTGFSYRPGTFAAGTHVVGLNSIDNKPIIDPLQLKYLQIASYIAAHIRQSIKKLTGFTTSAGVASSKLFSKIAASIKKPDAMTAIVPGIEANKLLDEMDVARVPGIGYSTLKTIFAKLTGAMLPDHATVAHWAGQPVSWMVASNDQDEMLMGDEADINIMNTSTIEEGSGNTPSPQLYFESVDLWDQRTGSTRRTVKSIREKISLPFLLEAVGNKAGSKVYNLLHGIDDSPVISSGKLQSHLVAYGLLILLLQVGLNKSRWKTHFNIVIRGNKLMNTFSTAVGLSYLDTMKKK